MASFPDALSTGPMVLDGGLATHLEARGHDLSSQLWSARLVLDDPDEVVAAHRDYFLAGAQVATTASYQASFDGLARLGLDRDAASEVLVTTVRLADRARREAADAKVRLARATREAGAATVRLADRARREAVDATGHDRPRWIAASIGPYGATLADGSEYRGDYGRSVAWLADWHRPRFEVLAGAGADVLALETVPCLAEVEALLTVVDGSGVPCWLSVTCDGLRTRLGEPLAAAFALAADVDEVCAVGVNCCRPDDVAPALALAGEVAPDLATVAYPNSGEAWDATRRRWVDRARARRDGDESVLARLVGAGADLAGGCCRTTPADIAALAAAVHR